MTALFLFASAFLTVFLLVFQQQNVQGRHYVLAALTSLGIGASQIFLWREIPGANGLGIVAALAGGPVGVLVSMWAHPRLVGRK